MDSFYLTDLLLCPHCDNSLRDGGDDRSDGMPNHVQQDLPLRPVQDFHQRPSRLLPDVEGVLSNSNRKFINIVTYLENYKIIVICI